MQSDATNSFLLRASELEVQGKFEEAAIVYEEVSRNQVNKGDFYRACDFLLESATQWEKAAYQARTISDFSEKIVRARKLSVETLALCERLEKPRKRMFMSYLESMVIYFDGILDANQEARRKKLDECISLAKSALSASEEQDDRPSIGRCCSRLVKYLFEFSLIEVDASKVVAAAKARPGYGEKAVAAFLELGGEKELVRAYYLAGLSHFLAIETLESEGERAIARRRAASYLSKAVEISQRVGDMVLLGNTLLVFGSLKEEWMEPVSFQKALELGKNKENNVLIAHALELLIVSTKWQMRGQEEEEKIRNLFRKELEYLVELEKVSERFAGTEKEWIRSTAYGNVADDYRWLAEFIELDPNKKSDLLKESIRLSNKGLEVASTAGRVHCLNAHSRASHYLASLAGDPEEKKQLLDQALTDRLQAIEAQKIVAPVYYWNLGVQYLTLSMIQLDLGEQLAGKERVDVYTEANRNALRGLDFLQKHLLEISRVASGQYAELGRYLEAVSKIQSGLYEFTADEQHLKKCTEVLNQAAENYDAAGIHSRAAEMHWRAADMQSGAGFHTEAAERFFLAGKKYAMASRRILPLKTLYHEYSSYMMAWNKIELGREYRLRGLHDKSGASYESAALILLRTDKWRGLATYYSAWSILERAESLSVQDKSEQALKEFAEASEKFEEAGKQATELIKEGGLNQSGLLSFEHESQVWKRYCLSRMSFEEARHLDERGERARSSVKYGEAAEVTERLSVLAKRSEDARNLRGIALFYRGLQQLSIAEDRSESRLYSESAEFFDRAVNESLDKRIRLSSAGNASLCRALEAIERFIRSKSLDVYSTVKLHLEAAGDFFTEGSLERASRWVKATQHLTDAHAYLISAQLTVDPREKREFFELSEKYLESSAGQFRSIGEKSKADEISQLLSRIKEEREFLAKPIDVPAPISLVDKSAAQLLMTGQEQAVGLKELEQANIQVQMTTSGEAILGQQLELRLDVANIGGSTATLLRMEDPIPTNVEAEVISAGYSLEQGSIDLRARRIESMKLETLRLRIKPLELGAITLCPRIVYVNEAGELRSNVMRPLVLSVQPPQEFQFKSMKAKNVFDYLLDSFIEDHMRRKFFVEKAGWRTLMDIVRSAGVPKSSMYGAAGPGDALTELLRRGLVESKEFPGERGRGGRVVRVRVSYEKEPIRRFVDERILRK